MVIGLVQGGVQSLSRSFYGRLVPPDKSGEFFGFFNLIGKFSGSWLLRFLVWYNSSSIAVNLSPSALAASMIGFALGWSLTRAA